MADYTELVKELRKYRATLPPAWEVWQLLGDAVDAIEELSQYANNIRRLKYEGWYLQQSKYHDGYQAIAIMPLPEPPKEETE